MHLFPLCPPPLHDILVKILTLLDLHFLLLCPLLWKKENNRGEVLNTMNT